MLRRQMSICAKRKQPFIPAKASVRAATEPPTKPDALTTTCHHTRQHHGGVKAGPKPACSDFVNSANEYGVRRHLAAEQKKAGGDHC
jgi:hypothetical protein